MMSGERNKMPNLWQIIEDIEKREYNNSVRWSNILHEARCAERMSAWEKAIFSMIYIDPIRWKYIEK